MNILKFVYASLTFLLLITNSVLAQTGSTVTKPTATTSTNRQQELYDQYHGVTKKATTATTTPTNAPAAPSTQPQRRASDYGSTQSTTVSSRSQQTSAYGSPSGVRIGVRGGVTYAFFTEEQPLIKPAVGFVGGLTFNFGAGAVSFQPEINYARYSVKADAFGSSNKGAGDVIEVPLLLKIASGSYLGNRFFVNVGPYGSYYASESVNGQKISLDGAKGRFGFGAALGIGAALKAGPGHVTVEVRGLYRLGDTEKGFNTDNNLNINGQVINSQLTLGYSFPLGGR